jgi:hypothetical protein
LILSIFHFVAPIFSLHLLTGGKSGNGGARNRAPCAIVFTNQDSVGVTFIPAQWEQWRNATD